MAAIQEAISSIRSLNGPTAEHLKTVVERMESGVDESRLEDWVGLVHEIATTGWHGWEAASAYINVAPDLFKARDIDYVLERGRFGHALGLYSFEPARQYFLGLELLSAGGILDKADAVEPGLKKIHSSFSQASNLLSDLTRLSFGIASTSGKDDLDSWFRLTTGAILDSKTSLETLVRLADGLEDNVPWTLVANIGESAPDSVNLYLSVHQILFESVSAEGIAVFSEQILNWAAPDVRYGGDHSGFVAWLRSLSLYVKHSSSDNSAELRKLNRIFESLPHPDIAVRMLNQLAIMGDSRPENLDRWIEEGSRLWGKNVSACQAWFDVESKTSRDYLKRLQGSVDLEDCKGLFQLYAEAMTGLVLHIEAFADDTENTVVHTDGKSVFMPPRVNKYAREEENYFFYKLCLLHQLAFFEFGTLNPEGLLPTTGYSRWFAGFHYPLLARNIFNLLEDARVDWRLMRKYRGLVIPMQQIMQETARKIQTRSCTSQFDEMMRRMLLFSLEGEAELENNHADMDALMDVMDFLKSSPGLESSISLTAIVYQILEPWFAEAIRNGQIKMASSGLLYEAVDWRGRLDAAWASMRLQLAPIEERIEDLLDSGDESLPMASQMDPDKVDIEKLVRGSNQNKEGVYLPDLDLSPEEGDEGCEESRIPEDVLRDLLAKLAIRKRKGDRFYYDEWDCLIQDYR
ncbi:MAG: hypothetical protein OEZ23_05430, partial [Gammaproteobacteria bacterium]|nr:hypothetical protein [Gammaproteobacteria bacterium]